MWCQPKQWLRTLYESVSTLIGTSGCTPCMMLLLSGFCETCAHGHASAKPGVQVFEMMALKPLRPCQGDG